MDEKLKNLDEKMNETVLKEITFSEVNKQRVLKKINYSKKSTNGIIYVRKYFPVAVSVVLIVIFFTEIIPFIGSQSKISEGNVRNEVSIYNELSNQIGDVESNEIEMQYNRSLATQYPDKFAIVKKCAVHTLISIPRMGNLNIGIVIGMNQAQYPFIWI